MDTPAVRPQIRSEKTIHATFGAGKYTIVQQHPEQQCIPFIRL